MNKKTFYFLILFVVTISVVPMVYSFGKLGMIDTVTQLLGSGFWIGVVGFIVFISVMIFLLKRWLLGNLKPKNIQNGLLATATVIKSYQGGMAIRHGAHQYYSIVIEVNVANPQGETWLATMKEMVNITQIGIFQPGVSFKVLYDPDDRSKIIFDHSQESQQQPFHNSVDIPGYGIVNSEMARLAVQQQPQDITMQLQAGSMLLNELNGNGITTSATVVSNHLIYNNYLNGNDVYEIRLRVNAADSAPFEAEIISLIAKPSIYKIEPGKTAYVKYDPNNPQRVGLSGLDKPDSAIEL